MKEVVSTLTFTRAVWVALTCSLFSLSALADNLTYAQLASLTARPAALSGQFEQTKHLAALETELTSTGEFDYTQGKTLNWVTQTPIQSRVELTPQGLTTFNSQGQDVTDPAIQTPQVAVFTELFFALMTSNWQVLESAFELSGTTEGPQWHATLTPKDPVLAQVFSTLSLSGGAYVDQVILNEVNGDSTAIRFLDLTPGEVQSEATSP